MRFGSTRKARCFPAADRQRHYRQRQNAGKIILHVEVDEIETTQALIDGGFLHADAADDKRAIAAAIERVIAMLIGSRDA
jgi:hypothetical protein